MRPGCSAFAGYARAGRVSRPGRANVVDGPFTTFYGAEWPIHYVGERGEWPIHHVAAGLLRSARTGNIALNHLNPGTGSGAISVSAKHQGSLTTGTRNKSQGPGCRWLIVGPVSAVAAVCLVRHSGISPVSARRRRPGVGAGGHSPTRSGAVGHSSHRPGPETTAPAGRSACTGTERMRAAGPQRRINHRHRPGAQNRAYRAYDPG
jgi:hypothetical protein